MGTSGGALLPPIQAVVHEKVNVSVSFVVPLVAFAFVLFYSLVGYRWIRYVDDPIVEASPIETKKADDSVAY